MGGENQTFQDLLREVLENPEKMLKGEGVTDEQVLEIQRHLNPYSYVTKEAGNKERKRSAAVSFTNLREDYLRRFTMTSFVGFIFQMLDEWEAPAEARRWEAPDGSKEAAWSPEALLERAQALKDLAQVAADAAAESKALGEAAQEAERAEAEAAATGGEAPEESSEELYRRSDAKLAEARGIRYAAMIQQEKAGRESAARLPAALAEARQHAEAREVLDSSPLPAAASREIPAAAAKALVRGFLATWLEYNPNAHVRKAHDEFVLASAPVPGLGEQPSDPADPERLPLAALRARRPAFATAADERAFEACTASPRLYNAAAHLLRNGAALEAVQAVCATEGGAERLRRYLFPVAAGSAARAAVDVVPPQDTFHRWNYYTEVNFEELRSATAAIYHEKPDLDWALILYDTFEGSPAEVDAAFEDFRDKHQDEIISDIKGVDFGAWTLLGDFKENREKITFYNKHTDVLKRILDRHAEDKKLGQDLMRNRVRGLKAENIRRDGPDAPGLSEYQSGSRGGVGAMGAEKVISREEMYRLERAKGDRRAAQELEVIDQCRQTIADLSEAAKVRELRPEEEARLAAAQKDLVVAEEMIEVPDDAIQIDVWAHDGKTPMAKTKFYTKAEAPEHTAEKLREERGERPGGKGKNRAAAGLAFHAQETLAAEIVRGRE
jgi:hypothetical protein